MSEPLDELDAEIERLRERIERMSRRIDRLVVERQAHRDDVTKLRGYVEVLLGGLDEYWEEENEQRHVLPIRAALADRD